jgi:hypothetical protein
LQHDFFLSIADVQKVSRLQIVIMIWIKIRSSLRLIFLNRPYPQAHAVGWISYLFAGQNQGASMSPIKKACPKTGLTHCHTGRSKKIRTPDPLHAIQKPFWNFWQRGWLRPVETEEMTIAYSERGHVVDVFMGVCKPEKRLDPITLRAL